MSFEKRKLDRVPGQAGEARASRGPCRAINPRLSLQLSHQAYVNQRIDLLQPNFGFAPSMDPGSRQPSVASSGDTSKVGVGGGVWDVGFSEEVFWRGRGAVCRIRSLIFPTTHFLQPTSRRSRLSGPMPRHDSTVMSPRRQTSLPWGVRIVGDEKPNVGRQLVATLHPTSYIPKRLPPAASQPPAQEGSFRSLAVLCATAARRQKLAAGYKQPAAPTSHSLRATS